MAGKYDIGCIVNEVVKDDITTLIEKVAMLIQYKIDKLEDGNAITPHQELYVQGYHRHCEILHRDESQRSGDSLWPQIRQRQLCQL